MFANPAKPPNIFPNNGKVWNQEVPERKDHPVVRRRGIHALVHEAVNGLCQAPACAQRISRLMHKAGPALGAPSATGAEEDQVHVRVQRCKWTPGNIH